MRENSLQVRARDERHGAIVGSGIEQGNPNGDLLLVGPRIIVGFILMPRGPAADAAGFVNAVVAGQGRVRPDELPGNRLRDLTIRPFAQLGRIQRGAEQLRSNALVDPVSRGNVEASTFLAAYPLLDHRHQNASTPLDVGPADLGHVEDEEAFPLKFCDLILSQRMAVAIEAPPGDFRVTHVRYFGTYRQTPRVRLTPD
jgi:hypothetical protein